ncbi:MAG: NUDIX domain-containing protein [Candidatus Staskawiczbacteria bacterium]|nr:NUDIX domain-containing protein [Candidatus Staskawiczbacteria bacterium]
MPKEKSAGAIIYRMENGVPHYLLLHYAPAEKGKRGQWGFAKGHVEQGETETETAKREIFEETGIKDLKIILGFKELEKYFFRRNYGLAGEARKKAPWVFKLVVFFLAETKTKDVKISDEHIDFVWLPIKEAIKKTTFKNSKKLLEKANEFVLSIK